MARPTTTDAIITRRGGGGGEVPENAKEMPMFGGAAGEKWEKNTLGLLLGNKVTLADGTNGYRPQGAGSGYLTMKAYIQEEKVPYSGTVFHNIWIPNKQKGIMIATGGTNENLYAKLFSIDYDPNSVDENAQLNLHFLRSSLIFSNTSMTVVFNEYNKNRKSEFLALSDTVFLLLYTQPVTNKLVFCFIIADWDKDTITLKSVTDILTDKTFEEFYLYYLQDTNKLVLVGLPYGNTSQLDYHIMSVSVASQTVAVLKSATLLTGHMMGWGFAFFPLGSNKYGLYTNASSTNVALKLTIFNFTSSNNTMTKAKENAITLSNATCTVHLRGAVLEYASSYAVILLSAAHGEERTHLSTSAVYKVTYSNNTATLIKYFGQVVFPFGDVIAYGAEQTGKKGRVYALGRLLTGKYASDLQVQISNFTNDYSSVTIEAYAPQYGVLEYDNYFTLFFISTSNTEPKITVTRKGAYLITIVPNNTVGSTQLHAPSLITEAMSRWKLGKATIPKNWLTE